MAARAIWKGVIRFGKAKVSVKLYSAVQDRTIHFRLLHKTDHQPVQQKMVSSESGKAVETAETRKAFPVSRERLVVFEEKELESLLPGESRDIEVLRFVDPSAIDHRWYERAYYLGPDTAADGDYFAVAEALAKRKKEGVARWVMRKKEYIGALIAEDGYLMLITLRYADEVISAESLEPPQGRALEPREITMAGQLLKSLEGEFDPEQFHDEYRARVMELVETKAHGGKVKVAAFRPRKTDEDKLAKTLEASLAAARGKKAAHGR